MLQILLGVDCQGTAHAGKVRFLAGFRAGWLKGIFTSPIGDSRIVKRLTSQGSAVRKVVNVMQLMAACAGELGSNGFCTKTLYKK